MFTDFELLLQCAVDLDKLAFRRGVAPKCVALDKKGLRTVGAKARASQLAPFVCFDYDSPDSFKSVFYGLINSRKVDQILRGCDDDFKTRVLDEVFAKVIRNACYWYLDEKILGGKSNWFRPVGNAVRSTLKQLTTADRKQAAQLMQAAEDGVLKTVADPQLESERYFNDPDSGECLRDARDQLTEDEWLVIRLRHFDDIDNPHFGFRTQGEAATLLGHSRRWVEPREQSAFQKIAATLAK